MIEGEVRIPKDGERYFALNKLDKITACPLRTTSTRSCSKT
jgi:transcription termination factor Rho